MNPPHRHGQVHGPAAAATETWTFELLTSPGPAAISTVRVCGAGAAAFLRQHVRARGGGDSDVRESGAVWRAALLEADGTVLDDILVSRHAPPPTGDVRLHLHGSPELVRRCQELLRAAGGVERPAAAGPLWEAADALETEGWALLPALRTLRGARWLLGNVGRLRAELHALPGCGRVDEVRTRCLALAGRVRLVEWFTRPARVALVGPPNAGKSTLTNALADQTVSLVSPAPGTTRDWVDVPGQVRGFPVTWIDTAGLRPPGDALEAAGVARTHDVLRTADAVVLVLDVTAAGAPWRAEFLRQHPDLAPTCVALNKMDLGASAEEILAELPAAWRLRATAISALTQAGFEALAAGLLTGLGRDEHALELPAAFTERQVALLRRAAAAADEETVRGALRECLGER